MDKAKEMMERIYASTEWSRARLGGGTLVHLMTGKSPYCGLVNSHSINKRSRVYPTQDAVTCIRCLDRANARGVAVTCLGTHSNDAGFVPDIAKVTRKEPTP